MSIKNNKVHKKTTLKTLASFGYNEFGIKISAQKRDEKAFSKYEANQRERRNDKEKHRLAMIKMAGGNTLNCALQKMIELANINEAMSFMVTAYELCFEESIDGWEKAEQFLGLLKRKKGIVNFTKIVNGRFAIENSCLDELNKLERGLSKQSQKIKQEKERVVSANSKIKKGLKKKTLVNPLFQLPKNAHFKDIRMTIDEGNKQLKIVCKGIVGSISFEEFGLIKRNGSRYIEKKVYGFLTELSIYNGIYDYSGFSEQEKQEKQLPNRKKELTTLIQEAFGSNEDPFFDRYDNSKAAYKIKITLNASKKYKGNTYEDRKIIDDSDKNDKYADLSDEYENITS